MKRPCGSVSGAYLLLALLLVLLPSCSQQSDNYNGGNSDDRNLAASATWMPTVVPYLDTVPSPIDGQGSAVVKPSEPLPVGSRGDFEITFTVGEAGIAPGGFVILQVSPWWGWSPPQTTYPEAPGYTVVRTSSAEPSVEVHALPLNRILVFSKQYAFPSGENIVFDYSGQVDKFAEAEELFQIFVDADADGNYACISAPPTVRTVARAASHVLVTAPSQVEPGVSLEIRAAPVDALGNWSVFPRGTYVLTVERNAEHIHEKKVEADSTEKTIPFTYTPPGEGIYFFYVEGPSGLRGKSNVTLCQEGTPTLGLYFGDIHGHSRISDGTGTPEDYYRYAREVSGLDIAALTDHADYGTIPVAGPAWERIKDAARNAHEPGTFITFLGFEWTNWEYGHRNVYYLGDDGPVFRSIDAQSDTPTELWKLLEPYQAMTVAHHVGGGPVATDWDVIPDKSKEWLVEICSIHGNSECFSCESSIYHPVEGAFVRDALARGYTLGIIGGGDTHDGHPGQRSAGALVNGILAVYSPELSREAIWEAFRNRHVYGTSGPKIILNFRVADHPMGSEVAWTASNGPVPVTVRAVGCAEIATVEIIRNGEVAFAEPVDGVFAQLVLEDPDPPAGVSWYYARVLQQDGNMAWSSPVWVTVE